MGDIPDAELATILQQRCALAPSHAARLVAVMRELQRRRQARRSALPCVSPMMEDQLRARLLGSVCIRKSPANYPTVAAAGVCLRPCASC